MPVDTEEDRGTGTGALEVQKMQTENRHSDEG